MARKVLEGGSIYDGDTRVCMIYGGCAVGSAGEESGGGVERGVENTPPPCPAPPIRLYVRPPARPLVNLGRFGVERGVGEGGALHKA